MSIGGGRSTIGGRNLAHDRRGRDFNWPVHHILSSHGVLIGEHPTNLRALAGHRVEVTFLAPDIAPPLMLTSRLGVD